LTVTDDMGATASTTVVVDPVVEPPTGQVVPTFVGGASTNGNRQVHSVTIPAGTRAGDLLLAFYGGNTNAAPTGPTGWSQLSTVGDGSSQGRAWSRVAGPTDAGSTLSVTTTAYTKSDLTVLVYRGGTGVTASHGRLDVDSGASHAAPVISSNGPVLAVSYWADRSSSAIALTVAGQTVRSSSLGTGGGRIAAAAADNATLAGPGPVGGAVATGTSSSSRLMSFTVLVGAGVG